MNYEKQKFVDGEVLTAEQLNHIENGIEEAMNAAKSVVGSNPNLLDNWYFADPINQRGVESFNLGYGIDRWNNYDSQDVRVTSEGLYFCKDAGSNGGNVWQGLENPNVLNNKMFSVSALDSEGVLYHACENSLDVNESKTLYEEDGKLIMWYKGPQGRTGLLLRFPLKTIVAAKLELGSQQTLARQENGVWVLNDPPPNKALELAKCQRYYCVVKANAFLVTMGNGGYALTITLPVPMREVPNVTYDGTAQQLNVLTPNCINFYGTTSATYVNYFAASADL